MQRIRCCCIKLALFTNVLAPSLDLKFAKTFVLGWPYPLVRHALQKHPGKSNLCAIITAIHE
jgi:hypothetical protein